MKIRTFIFLFVISLGLLPILVLVSLNLPRTVSRFESAARIESQALSQASFTRLNARITCLKKSLNRSVTLPYTANLLTMGNDGTQLATTLTTWFTNDLQVTSLRLYDRGQRPGLIINRSLKGELALVSDPAPVDDSLFKAVAGLQNGEILPWLVPADELGLAVNRPPKYVLQMAAPVFDGQGRFSGVMVMLINLAEFLDDYHDSLWVAASGDLVHGCIPDPAASGEPVTAEDCSMDHYPALRSWSKDKDMSNPVVLNSGQNGKTAWLPLYFGYEAHPVMWIGSVVDESAIVSWKRFVFTNVLSIVCLMGLVVFFAAGWINRRIDKIRTELLNGLDTILHHESQVQFKWKGPREITTLAADLSALSKRYATICRERNQAESASRESEEKFRSLASSAKDGIILVDRQGMIAYWNKAATEMFGFSGDEALQRSIHELIQLRSSNLDKQPRALLENPDIYTSGKTLELLAGCKDGSDIPVELSLSSARIQDAWHGIWIVRDVSERKKSEEQSKKQQRQLQHADKMISLGLLVSGVAHEINNPNSIALLNLPLIARSWESVKPILDEYYEEYGEFTVAGIDYSEMRQQVPKLCIELEESALRIKQIVKDLKDHARQESSGELQGVDINEVVASAVRLTANSIRRATHRFSATYADQLPRVSANVQRLVQVVINLVQNSCEALQNQEQEIRVVTRYNQENQGVEIEVFDEGIGIAHELVGKVTDPFFTTKRTLGGTGLGLSVSAGIIKEYNGLLTFTSEPGKWTRAVVSLPVSPD